MHVGEQRLLLELARDRPHTGKRLVPTALLKGALLLHQDLPFLPWLLKPVRDRRPTTPASLINDLVFIGLFTPFLGDGKIRTYLKAGD